MNIKKPNSFARYGNDYVAPLTTIDQIVKPSGERYTDREFELMSNVENVMFGENCAGKNLLNPTLETTTLNGVTCTNNGDGTYTLNGTASNNCNFIIYDKNLANENIGLKEGVTYKVIGCPSGGSIETYRIMFNFWDTPACFDIGNGANKQFDSSKTGVRLDIIINSGTVCNNLVFKPMLTTDLTATYDDFEPYIKSLKQLTNSALSMDLLWTNASPTSAFASQTINLDLSSYKFLKIEFKEGLNNEQYMYRDIFFNTTVLCNLGLNANGYRLINANNSRITIGNYVEYTSYNSSSLDTYNQVRIPTKIYGIK